MCHPERRRNAPKSKDPDPYMRGGGGFPLVRTPLLTTSSPKGPRPLKPPASHNIFPTERLCHMFEYIFYE